MDDDMAELIQHEYDHLDGILATMRAIDSKSFVMKELCNTSRSVSAHHCFRAVVVEYPHREICVWLCSLSYENQPVTTNSEMRLAPFD